MEFLEIFTTYGYGVIITLVIFSFIAGFIDAVVGGGGLIQLPALLIGLPQMALPSLLGTNKIAALSGTSIAAFQYARKITFNIPLLIVISICAGIGSFCGAQIISFLDSNTLKPIILAVLIVIACYTYLKKDLGSIHIQPVSLKKQFLFGSLMGLVIGFYDGFFGPGTGSFFVLGFVLMGFEFIQASAYAKIINCMTNLFALLVFIKNGDYLLGLAIIIAISNITGNFIGSKMALSKGNSFIRSVFLGVVTILIIRYGYDIFL